MKSVFTIKNIYFFSAIGLGVYLVLRAIYVPPVHDEAATFMHYVQRDEWKPFQAHWDANNHILNSFLSAQFFKIFGQGLIPLRLASLLFFPLYVIYLFKISQFLKNKRVQTGFLLGMLGVHNLMEYFGYSRGYAMSMALLMAAIYYLIQYFQYFELKKLWPFYIFSSLGLIANLTLFNTMLLLNGLLFLSFLIHNKSWVLKFIYLLLGALPIIAVAYLSFEMKKLGLLYYGSNKGFYEVTVWSLVILLYDSWQPALATFFIIIGSISVFLLGAGKFSEGFKMIFFTNRWLFAILFIGNIVATILLQKIMGVNYPEDRTAMYFYFFLVMFFCFALDFVAKKKSAILTLIWIVAPVHFAFNINLNHSSYWWYEHIPNSFYKEVQKRAGDHPEEASIGGYILMDMIWAYYNHQADGKLNDIQTKDYPSFYYDYLILYDDNNADYAEKDYNLLLESPVSHIRLLERKKKMELKFVYSNFLEDMHDNTEEFIEFFKEDYRKEWYPDPIYRYRNLCFEVSVHFQNEDDSFFGMFTLATDAGGKRTNLENQELHLMRTEWKEGYDFTHRIYVQNLSPDTEGIMVYFWNPKKRKVNMSNIRITIYTWE